MVELVEYRNLIGGELRQAASGQFLDAVNPATGEVFARVPAGEGADVDAAVAAARTAFPAWSALTADQRAAYLRKVAALFTEYGDELGRLETVDNGRIVRENVPRNGPGMTAMWTLAASQTLEAATGQTVVLGPNRLGLTRREPYGVIAAIIPWNAPISMLSAKAAFALAAGNTVVVKPAEQASVSVLRLGELLADVLPPGVLNIVSGLGRDAGEHLVRHPGISKITMTGSSETGRAIQRAAADTLTPSIFELGGKSPNIIFADADLEAAANGATVTSVFTGNAGQVCVAGSRILVQRPILAEMLGRIRAIAEKVVLGDPLDPATTMGPIISRAQYDRVVGYLETGAKEAELVFGGRHGAEVVPSLPGGYWVEPTLFLSEDNSPRICQEEIFGPVAVVIPFDTDDEALAIANDSRYGLAAGVWTRDLARVHRFLRDLDSGNVWVNIYRQTGQELPFGGIKDSGYGHDRVLEFTREKSAVIAT
ncbi:aldehyde dehydrogenase family protein [Frankia sp. CNm7]|uniref:Aldehyde dehydrogenase family protein n=1 Tax=Frankia nepalensis TaxID=1836974 RepID=A0A937RSU3_9ACTN|nr:aldehyde dehydrogenase family protein [Frankia nepalensis]MBL7499139.1 aldehyde dehydrogenase family protein [Frankia nepalensis]MBL7511043.1 aldehyde dehydrogenase family protein [Frankia nepalensis]MBL7520489.1 aldehyde dehydrogenase family protein [Frankia nepalensis]MBL7632123.1 aldehyde dehydrogenase family protein [Frankia nepalensis]